MCDKLRALKKSGITRSTNIHGGDDYLGFVPEDKASAFGANIIEASTEIGMISKLGEPACRETATFYRKYYVDTGTTCRPVPQLGRVLAKLPIRANQNAQVNDADYMAGKLNSAAFECRYLPEIRDLMLETAVNISKNPYYDDKENRKRWDDSEQMYRDVAVEPIPSVLLNSWCERRYNVSHDAIVNDFKRVCGSITNYIKEWVVMDKGIPVNKKENWKFEPDKLDSEAIQALLTIDCA